MAFLSSLKQIAGIESTSIAQEFMSEFFKLVVGTLSLPIDLPGTNYNRGFQVISHLSKDSFQNIYLFINIYQLYTKVSILNIT